MIVEEIKKSILQSASEGKLTYQKSEENAEEELKGILEDAKDDKKYTYNKLSDIPFNLPDNWIWVKLEDIAFKITDGTHSTPKYTLDGIPFLSVKDLSSGVMNFKNTKFISKEEHNVLFKRCNPEYGDILITKVGTTGIPVIVNTTNEFSLFVSVALIKFNKENIFNKYLYYILSSPVVQSQVVENTRGVGNKNWVLNAIKSTILPLPPLEEQQRIVDKIEELFSKLDEIKPIEEELKDIKDNFPNEIKKSILQFAIEGNLTKRYSSDTSVDDMITKITENRSQKIKEKISKNDKYKESIQNLGIAIPKEWKWLRLGEIGNWGSGSTPERGNVDFYNNGNISWLKTGELTDGYVTSSVEKITETALKKCSFKINKPGDVLIAMYGATIGKLGIATEEITTNQACCGCTPYIYINNKYLFYYLLAVRSKLISMGEGSGQPNISREKIINFPFPLPSIEEQQRIVEKLEQLLPLCDDIEKMISK